MKPLPTPNTAIAPVSYSWMDIVIIKSNRSDHHLTFIKKRWYRTKKHGYTPSKIGCVCYCNLVLFI